jgi:hypothetical protein
MAILGAGFFIVTKFGRGSLESVFSPVWQMFAVLAGILFFAGVLLILLTRALLVTRRKRAALFLVRRK